MSIRITIDATIAGDIATITGRYTEHMEDGGIIGHKRTLWSGPVMALATTNELFTAEEVDEHLAECLYQSEAIWVGRQ